MQDLQKYLEQQKNEALGPDNRWHCSKYYGHEVTDSETLLRYYIKNGGAVGFRQRANQADQKSNQPPTPVETTIPKLSGKRHLEI